mmetsp:Transcript_23011/g.50157  ORF Transcript_23011/g.50157 Transcript_23011/m.50157 type:complete len:241 (-) Transcript_23011:16-738(-)
MASSLHVGLASLASFFDRDLKEWLLIQDGPPTATAQFMIYLFCYCNFVAGKCATGMREREHLENWVKSLVTCCLAAFGGSFINPVLLGVKAPPIEFSSFFLVSMCFAWWMNHNTLFGEHWRLLMKNPIVKAKMAGIYEVFRLWVTFAWYSKAVSLLPATGQLVGPIICGTLGGSGGMFFPLDKGLGVLSNGVPWNMESCFYFVTVYHVANMQGMEDLHKGYLRCLMVLILVYTRVFPAFF